MTIIDQYTIFHYIYYLKNYKFTNLRFTNFTNIIGLQKKNVLFITIIKLCCLIEMVK